MGFWRKIHIVGHLQKFRDDVSGYDDSPQLALWLGDGIALLHVDTELSPPDTLSRMESISHSSQKTR